MPRLGLPKPFDQDAARRSGRYRLESRGFENGLPQFHGGFPLTSCAMARTPASSRSSMLETCEPASACPRHTAGADADGATEQPVTNLSSTRVRLRLQQHAPSIRTNFSRACAARGLLQHYSSIQPCFTKPLPCFTRTTRRCRPLPLLRRRPRINTAVHTAVHKTKSSCRPPHRHRMTRA